MFRIATTRNGYHTGFEAESYDTMAEAQAEAARLQAEHDAICPNGLKYTAYEVTW